MADRRDFSISDANSRPVFLLDRVGHIEDGDFGLRGIRGVAHDLHRQRFQIIHYLIEAEETTTPRIFPALLCAF